MSTRWIAATVAVFAVAVTPALLTSPDSTQAGWREELTISLPDTQSGAYSVGATDTTNTVDHTQGAPADVANEPSMTIKNNATRVSGWIDVISGRATVPASNTTNMLLSDIRLSYDPTSTDCLSGASGSTYWSVNGGNALTAGTEFFRNGSAVAGDDLGPGQTKTLCPLVSRSGTDRDFLLSHGGRQLDIQTKVRQRTHAPATASSASVGVESRYQVKLPSPTTGSDGIVCSRTTVAGDRSSTDAYASLYVAWPFAADGWELDRRTIMTPAMDRFVVMRQDPDTLVWAPFLTSTDQTTGAVVQSTGNDRQVPAASTAINSDWIDNNGGRWVNFKVRAFPYSGTSVHVESDWVVPMQEVTDQVRCGTPVPNPNSAPVGLS